MSIGPIPIPTELIPIIALVLGVMATLRDRRIENAVVTGWLLSAKRDALTIEDLQVLLPTVRAGLDLADFLGRNLL